MGVSKVKYWYVIDCSFGSLSREVLGPLSFPKLDAAVKLCLPMPVIIVEFCPVLSRDIGISSLVSVAIMGCEGRRQHEDRIVPTNWKHFKVNGGNERPKERQIDLKPHVRWSHWRLDDHGEKSDTPQGSVSISVGGSS